MKKIRVNSCAATQIENERLLYSLLSQSLHSDQ